MAFLPLHIYSDLYTRIEETDARICVDLPRSVAATQLLFKQLSLVLLIWSSRDVVFTRSVLSRSL